MKKELIITPETVEEAVTWLAAGIANANGQLEVLSQLSALGKSDPEKFQNIVAKDGNNLVHDLLSMGIVVSLTADMYLGNTSTKEADDIMKAIDKIALTEAENIYPV